MRKLLSIAIVALALLTSLPARAESSGAPSTEEIQDAVRRMQEGLPVIMRLLDVLGREAPALQQIMQKAAAQGGKVEIGPVGPEGPSAEQMTENFKALQRVFAVLREAAPIFERVQRDLNVDAVNAPVKTPLKMQEAPPATNSPQQRSSEDAKF
jgi:hypothetical protein